MSKQSNTKQNEQKQSQAASAKPKYNFSDYQDDDSTRDTSRVDGLVTDEFDPDQWDLLWARYDRHEKTQRRYFEQVCRDTHGHLFKDKAFDPILGVIGKGKEYLHSSLGGIYELTLWMRPIEAKIAEDQQMQAASARRLQDNEKIKEIKDRTGGVVGANVFGGVSMSHSSKGWLQ